VKRAEQQVAVAEARIKEAKREPIPNLTVRAGEWYSGEVIESAHKPAGPESFVDASVNISLWNRNQGNIEAAKVELERAHQDVKRTQLYLKHQSEPLAQQYLSSRFEAERYGSELLPRARRAYQLYLMKYQQMAAAYPQVLVSQRTLFQLQVDYLQALGTEWSNALALQNYTLTNGLEQPMAAGTDTTTLNLPTGGDNQ
jgi:cobalt-zinc-cadmium efflux system outer membrane protein